MFTHLVESRRTAQRGRAGAVASVAVHAVLLGGAVVATATGTRPPRHAPEPPLVLVTPPANPPTSGGSHEAARRGSARRAAPADPIPDPLHVDTDRIHVSTPAISLDTLVSTSHDDTWVLAGGGARGTGSTSGAGAPWDAGLVDRPADPLAGNPAPAYPEALRAAGVEGTVEARFVIDTTGRVEPASIAFDPGTDALFAAAVRRALARARFTPAEARGRRVRVLVRQAFAFRLAR